MSSAGVPGRILALDIGERRIGVAVSDKMQLTTGPLGVIERTKASEAVETIARLVEEKEAVAVVAGLPLTLQGEVGPQARRVESFVDILRRRLAVPVTLVDERLTTVQGERALREMKTFGEKRKKAIDPIAAQLILQHYLETQRNST